ncbi:SDR family NAD(P)-dependent oxidoreductase [Sphingomonas immobilis]|nr:SDR family oxidoreductase [Sphingomonas sp. CA1-15]
MKDFLGLEGKVAMVVGGGLGMGESTSVTLAEAGCDVAVVDIDRARAEGVAARVRETGRRAVAVVADAMDAGTAAGSVAEVVRALGRIDVMATIVGQAEWSTVLDVTEETWDLDHRRNLRYFFFYAQAAARAMVKAGNGGAIAAVASVSGLQSAPNHAAYGAAKAGLVNLVRTMGVELAPHGIRVNAVAPGTISTPRINEGPHRAAFEEKIRNSLIPFRRLGTTQEIANGLLFLLSDLAGYVTGQTLAVDGGFTAQFLLGAPREA